MLKKSWTRMLMIGLAVIGLTVGATTVFAQSGDDPAAPALFAMRGAFERRGGDSGFFGGGPTHDETFLADELGITAEELQAARDAAHQSALEQALAEGQITEEQIADMEAHEALRDYVNPQALLAEVLGVSVDDLTETTPAALMEELGLDHTTLQEQIQAAHEAAVAQAVTDGVITQEQADNLVNQPGPGMRGGSGGHPRSGFPRGEGRSGSAAPTAGDEL